MLPRKKRPAAESIIPPFEYVMPLILVSCEEVKTADEDFGVDEADDDKGSLVSCFAPILPNVMTINSDKKNPSTENPNIDTESFKVVFLSTFMDTLSHMKTI